jgi:hypothetical protein
LDLKEKIKTGLKEGKDEKLKSKMVLDEKNFEADFEKQFSLFEKEMDDLAEQRFDRFAQINRAKVDDIINTDNEATRKEKLKTLSDEFAKLLFEETDQYFDNIKGLAITPYEIEINDLRNEVNKGILKSDVE